MAGYFFTTALNTQVGSAALGSMVSTPLWGNILAASASVLGAAGSLASAQAEANAAEANAAQARAEAAANAETKRKENAAKLSAMRAKYGSSGVEMTGTPVIALADSAGEGELDALKILYSGNVEAENYKRQAKSSTSSGLFGVGTSLLAGGAKVFG